MNRDSLEHLRNKGYVVVEDVLNEEQIAKARGMFYDWAKNIPDIEKNHKKINVRGIFKYHEAGHQEHAWYLRTLPCVKRVFADLHQTNDLIVSYDGCCWITPEHFAKCRDKCWTHVDENPKKCDKPTYQGFVSLTSNTNTSLVVYEESHKLFNEYFERHVGDKKITSWNKIEKSYLERIQSRRKVLCVPAGAVVVWDSRTFHQNQYGYPDCEERIVQYINYMPRADSKNTKSNKRKRIEYFATRRTTGHRPCAMKVNARQPNTFGNVDLLIDYTSLHPPRLSHYMPEILNLI